MKTRVLLGMQRIASFHPLNVVSRLVLASVFSYCAMNDPCIFSSCLQVWPIAELVHCSLKSLF